MLVRRLAVAATVLLVPLAAGCGSGGGKPSTADLSAKIQESESGLTDEQATCMAEAMRDVLPADALREIMDADLDSEGETVDEAAFDRVSETDGVRLMGAMFECIDFGDLGDLDDFDPGDLEGFEDEGPGQSPFGN